MTTSNNYYVYEHWRLDRDECFYVGKGHGSRAFSMKNRNKHHQAIVSKLNRIGSAFEVKIVASGLSEEEAFKTLEQSLPFKHLIKAVGLDSSEKAHGQFNEAIQKGNVSCQHGQ